MLSENIKVWTPTGYKHVNDLAHGERVMSLNLDRGYMEYDNISKIRTEYTTCGMMGPVMDTFKFWLTPDHDLFLRNRDRSISRIMVNDAFCKTFQRKRLLVRMRPFEPYLRTQDMEDVRWSARMAASYCRSFIYPTYSDDIWDIIQDLGGEEAIEWTHTFLHWGKLHNKSPQFEKTVLMRNPHVLKMCFHVIPRTGHSVRWGSTYIGRSRFRHAVSLLFENDVSISRLQWRADRYTQIVYNLATRNGSFLGSCFGGTYIFTCEIGG